MNRALIVKSFYESLELVGQSKCEDVLYMQKALQQLKTSHEFNCGDAGTVLRFLSLRLAREKGIFRLKGTERLFQRPHEDLFFLLNQLGVQTETLPNELILNSQGWKKPLVPLRIHREKSSQFSTGLVLSCWKLPYALEFELTPAGVKDSYWKMTLDFLQTLGMEIEDLGNDRYRIPANQELTLTKLDIEPDYSSAFAIAATAALCGETRIQGVGNSSLQPDYSFIEILKKMKIPILLQGSELGVLKAVRILPIDAILTESPDLFPVLSVLCAFADGNSSLLGAPRLVFKESNRIKKSAELLELMGVEATPKDDGLHIQGKARELKPREFEFDPDQDHRMAMAAGILKKLGWPIKIKNPKVVNKSFPEFWSILGIQP